MANVQETLDAMKIEVDAFAAANAAFAKHKKNPSDVELKQDFLVAQAKYRKIYDARIVAERAAEFEDDSFAANVKAFGSYYTAPSVIRSKKAFAAVCKAERVRYYANSVCSH